ncbi:ROK family transcriptional regulator [Bifidobacterium sp. 64T4]|uniref:ROK family transcriptional regulator n=1 Tax=Bifidobacterium pongonis TaxID=2834432 RepID=UPI001C5A195A|nr:ROK family transcriptional regulator [Bifidobacterium pongonis]MBW3094154.1 ROK family transcriptional regulator [Bifidobacterium pongonis]
MNTANPNTASQAGVAETNRSRVMQHLYHHGTSSRAQIAKALGLTPAAITKITAQLIEANAIEETGGIEGAKNRRSIGLALDTTRFHVIGVKFARSLVQIGVFDLAGHASSLTALPYVSNETITETIATVHSTISQLLDSDPTILAIGMAVPGPYLRGIGHTAVVSSMQGWRAVNFITEFAGSFRVPVLIEQDARAGVLANYLFDPETETGNANLAYYLVGEGVGLGVIDNGRIINGELGTATEIGHVSIDVNGKPCDCGNIGCLERYCSTPAIHQMIIDEGTLIPGAAAMSHTEACRELFKLANNGNETALAMIRTIGKYVGYGCLIIFNAFNPHTIVIGDIVSEAGQPLLDEVKQTVKQRAIPEIYESTTIRLTSTPTDAAVLGAAAVAISYFLDHPSEFFDLK